MIETLDLSKLEAPVSVDREFDQRFLGDAINYLKRIRDLSVDYITPTSKLQIKETGDKWSTWLDSPDGVKVFKPTPWALAQTIGMTELPKKYHDALIAHGHIDEAVNHLNMWLHDEERNLQIRTVDQDYRALVSTGYVPFDNYDLFELISKAMSTANRMRDSRTKPALFYRAQVTDHNLYVHIIDEGREWDLGKGDTYKPMIVVKNSEVGDGALRLEIALWRYMCANLQIHGVISKKIHVGDKLAEGIWSPETRQAQSNLWRHIVSDAMNLGLGSDQLFEPILDGLRETKEIKISDPVVTVRKLAKANKMTENEEKDIIAAMMGDTTVMPDDKGTLFQVINGVTQAAKTQSIERGIEFNRIAGDIPAMIKVVA